MYGISRLVLSISILALMLLFSGCGEKDPQPVKVEITEKENKIIKDLTDGAPNWITEPHLFDSPGIVCASGGAVKSITKKATRTGAIARARVNLANTMVGNSEVNTKILKAWNYPKVDKVYGERVVQKIKESKIKTYWESKAESFYVLICANY